MSRNKANVELKNFSKGLITETNPINGSLDTARELKNFRLNLDGSVQVRDSLVTSAPSTGFNVSTTSGDIERSYIWKNPKNYDGDIIVVSGEDWIVFTGAGLDGSGDPVLDRLGKFNLSLDAGYAPLSSMKTTTNGELVVGGSGVNCFKYTVNDSGVIEYEAYVVKVNDFFGVDDGLAVDDNGNDMFFQGGKSVANKTEITRHNYNILNQGFTVDALFDYKPLGRYPNKSSSYSSGFNASDEFDAALQIKRRDLIGYSEATSGHYVIPLLKRGTERKAIISANTSTTDYADTTAASDLGGDADYILADDTTFPTSDSGYVVATFSGRLWYAPTKSVTTEQESTAPALQSMVAFSRSLTSTSRLGQCHGKNDPTSGEYAGVIDSDGGYIRLDGVNTIRSLVPYQNSLLILADEGVWEVTSNGVLTSANYNVRQITDSGTLPLAGANEMVVTLQDQVMYWSRDGIQVLSPNGQSGRIVATNITRDTISAKYKEYLVRELVASTYDPSTSVVRWLTLDTDGTYYELLYNSRLGAFYEYVLTELISVDTKLIGYLVRPATQSEEGSVSLVGSVRIVANNAVDKLQMHSFTGDSSLVVATMLTSEETFGDASKKKTATQLTMYLAQTEKTQDADGLLDQGSCLVQTRWDFSDNIVSNKFSREFQAYRLLRHNASGGSDYVHGQSVVVTRNKIRGSGRSLAIQISSELGKKCHLYGYSLNIESNSET